MLCLPGQPKHCGQPRPTTRKMNKTCQDNSVWTVGNRLSILPKSKQRRKSSLPSPERSTQFHKSSNDLVETKLEVTVKLAAQVIALVCGLSLGEGI